MIKFDNVSLSFENKKIIDDLNFTFEDKKTYAIMGESGIGKTTILNIIAGLLKIDSGSVSTDNARVAYLFQDARLFPWLTVADNVTIVSDEPKEVAKYRALSILEKLGLLECSDMYPDELSGGMKQRVSIARALMYEHDILLLDEPFRALDEETAKTVAEYVFDESNDKTVIFVTHDKNDVIYADYVIYAADSPITSLFMEKSSKETLE